MVGVVLVLFLFERLGCNEDGKGGLNKSDVLW